MKFQLTERAWIIDSKCNFGLEIEHEVSCQCSTVWQAQTCDCNGAEEMQHDPVCACVQRELNALGFQLGDLEHFNKFTKALAKVAVEKVDLSMIKTVSKEKEIQTSTWKGERFEEAAYRVLDFICRCDVRAIFDRMDNIPKAALAAWQNSTESEYLLRTFIFWLEEAEFA